MESFKQMLFLVSVLLPFLVISQPKDVFDLEFIPDELKFNANAVVRFNEKRIVIHSQQKMTETLTRIVTVFNEKGFRYTNAIVGFDKYRKVRKIEASVYNEDGEEIKKIKKKDFVEQSAVDGGTLYSDSRVLYLAYQPVSYPITIRFSYEIDDRNTAAIRAWEPIEGYFLGIEKDTYTLIDEAKIKLSTKQKNFEGYNVNRSQNQDTLKYEINNVRPLKPESLSPSLNKLTPYAMINAEKFHYYGVDGRASNWEEFGNWVYNELLEGRQAISQDTKQEVLDLIKGINDPIEKAKLIYKYVQNNTRYISVQVGIGGVQPILASEVDRVKYGDCKGLTNYTQALLREAGVESYYTVVEAGNEIVDFEDDFPTLAQGNHIILAIPNKEDMIWVDCTSQKHPFGFIGDFTDNRNVLLVKDSGSEIIKTEAYINTKNNIYTKADITINEDGSFNSKVQIASKGINYDTRFILQDYSDKDLKDVYKEYWSYINNLSINSHSFVDDKESVVLNEDIDISALDYASIKDEKLIFSPNVFNKDLYIPKRYKNRQFPFEIQRGFQAQNQFKISIPSNYRLSQTLDDIEIENKFGHYKVSYNFQENILTYTRDFFIKKGMYNPKDYEQFRKFKRTVAKHDKSVIILNQL